MRRMTAVAILVALLSVGIIAYATHGQRGHMIADKLEIKTSNNQWIGDVRIWHDEKMNVTCYILDQGFLNKDVSCMPDKQLK